METVGVVGRICRLPVDFYSGSKSMVQLVAESGIRECPSALAASVISPYLTDHPELIEYWLRWSENKRVSSGSYLICRSGGYVVGFHPNGETLAFTEPPTACAEFVVREVRTILAIPLTRKLHIGHLW